MRHNVFAGIVAAFAFAATMAMAQEAAKPETVAKIAQDGKQEAIQPKKGQAIARGASPIGLSLVQPIQFPPSDWDMVGLRINILAGQHNNVGFLDIGGLANFTSGDLGGISIAGLWNHANGNMDGFQFAGIGNYNGGNATGLQIAGLVNYNAFDTQAAGIQIATVNVCGDFEGIQIAAVNKSDRMTGAQIGAINVTERLNGLQIGGINIIKQSLCPVMIGINIGF